jgi:hypothetical protein
MAHPVKLQLTAPFQLGDMVAEIEMEGGEKVDRVLRGGALQGELHARAKRLRLTQRGAPDGSALAPERPDEPAGTAPHGEVVDILELFEKGVDIPEDGSLTLQLTWSMPCDSQSPPPEDKVGPTLFNFLEHRVTSEWIGLDQKGQKLRHGGFTADFSHATPLDVGGKNLVFGDIMGLAADYYAYLDDTAAATPEIAAMWPDIGGLAGWVAGDYRKPTLAGDSRESVEKLLRVVSREGGFQVNDLNFPLRRYGALASQNFCHFASQPWDGAIDDGRNDALKMYRAYHRRAIAEARAAGDARSASGLFHALVVEAFACHFLTDLFATGHIRVPRRELSKALDIVDGGIAAGLAHNEDNRGLWVKMRKNPPGSPRFVWWAVGDAFLFTKAGAMHLQIIKEAVRRAVDEVFAAFAHSQAPLLAEDLLPVPLPPGKGRAAGDIAPNAAIMGPVHAAGQWPQASMELVNGYPMYALAPDGRLGKRIDAGPEYDVVRGSGKLTLGGGQ